MSTRDTEYIQCTPLGSGDRWRMRCAFSLVELVIVLVIMGLLVAIAVPRFGEAARSSQDTQVVINLRILQDAIDRYAAEHHGPCIWAGGGSSCSDNDIDVDSIRWALLENTDTSGAREGEYGPYLRSLPENPHQNLACEIATWGVTEAVEGSEGKYRAQEDGGSFGEVGTDGGGGGGGGIDQMSTDGSGGTDGWDADVFDVGGGFIDTGGGGGSGGESGISCGSDNGCGWVLNLYTLQIAECLPSESCKGLGDED